MTVQQTGRGTVDLTGANYFLRIREPPEPDLRTELVAHLETVQGGHTATFNGTPLRLSAVVRILLNALASMHSLWSLKTV